MDKLLIYNGFVVNQSKIIRASILIENKKISKIFSEINLNNYNDIEIFDASGKYVFPGIIDTHVHFREPGLTQKADIYSESRAAAAGGVTTFFDMPNTIPQVIDNESLLEKIEIAEKKSLINYSFYVGATNDNLDYLLTLNKQKIPAIKLFYASSTGNMLVNNLDFLVNLFQKAPIPIVVHSEKNEIIDAELQKLKQFYGNNISTELHPKIRSTQSCIVATKELVSLALKNNAQLHILHLTTADEVDYLEKVKTKNITCEVSPNHLFFDSSDYLEYGNLIKCNPAIKSKEHKLSLLKGLKNDIIDSVATDHAPHTFEQKQKEYLQAPSGIPSVQHSLNILLEFVIKGDLTIEKVVEKMCHKPAEIFNVKNRGFISEGFFADLTIVDLDSKTNVTKENLLYKCMWSPVEGKTFNSSIVATIVNGKFVYKNNKIIENKSAMRVEFDR